MRNTLVWRQIWHPNPTSTVQYLARDNHVRKPPASEGFRLACESASEQWRQADSYLAHLPQATVGGAAIATQSQHGARNKFNPRNMSHEEIPLLWWTPSLNKRRKLNWHRNNKKNHIHTSLLPSLQYPPTVPVQKLFSCYYSVNFAYE